MGQVLGFAHCKESPSTASTTPDSTDGGNDESDFPELQTAREFSEDEEEASVEWGTPRELTFSYITIAAPPNSSPTLGDHGPRGRRDSQTRRARAPLPRTETCETFVPALGDSLENIPSLCPSPEGEGAPPPGHGHGLDPFTGWGVPTGYIDEPEGAEGEEAAAEAPCPRLVRPTLEAEWSSSSNSRASSSDTSLEDLPPPDALAPPPEEGCPCGAEPIQRQAPYTPEEALSSQHLALEEMMEEAHEDEEGLDQEPVTQQHQIEPDQSGNMLEMFDTGRHPCVCGEVRLDHYRLAPRDRRNQEGRKEGRNGAIMANTVADLVYWRDTRKSACVFTVFMVALLCLLHFSIISVVSYVSLAALTVTIALRVYSKVLLAIHRGEGHNPFQAQLDADFGLSKEQLEHLTERVVFYVTSGTKSLQRLFLVYDMVESIKFAFFFYILTYVGAVFNGLTLLILGVISAFTFPLLYRQHQTQIDQYVGLVRNQLSNLRAKMLAKLPTAKAKAE
ncbi:reticulon-2 isoform X1 [Pogona vitticeps]